MVEGGMSVGGNPCRGMDHIQMIIRVNYLE